MTNDGQQIGVNEVHQSLDQLGQAGVPTRALLQSSIALAAFDRINNALLTIDTHGGEKLANRIKSLTEGKTIARTISEGIDSKALQVTDLEKTILRQAINELNQLIKKQERVIINDPTYNLPQGTFGFLQDDSVFVGVVQRKSLPTIAELKAIRSEYENARKEIAFSFEITTKPREGYAVTLKDLLEIENAEEQKETVEDEHELKLTEIVDQHIESVDRLIQSMDQSTNSYKAVKEAFSTLEKIVPILERAEVIAYNQKKLSIDKIFEINELLERSGLLGERKLDPKDSLHILRVEIIGKAFETLSTQGVPDSIIQGLRSKFEISHNVVNVLDQQGWSDALVDLYTRLKKIHVYDSRWRDPKRLRYRPMRSEADNIQKIFEVEGEKTKGRLPYVITIEQFKMILDAFRKGQLNELEQLTKSDGLFSTTDLKSSMRVLETTKHAYERNELRDRDAFEPAQKPLDTRKHIEAARQKLKDAERVFEDQLGTFIGKWKFAYGSLPLLVVAGFSYSTSLLSSSIIPGVIGMAMSVLVGYGFLKFYDHRLKKGIQSVSVDAQQPIVDLENVVSPFRENEGIVSNKDQQMAIVIEVRETLSWILDYHIGELGSRERRIVDDILRMYRQFSVQHRNDTGTRDISDADEKAAIEWFNTYSDDILNDNWGDVESAPPGASKLQSEIFRILRERENYIAGSIWGNIQLHLEEAIRNGNRITVGLSNSALKLMTILHKRDIDTDASSNLSKEVCTKVINSLMLVDLLESYVKYPVGDAMIRTVGNRLSSIATEMLQIFARGNALEQARLSSPINRIVRRRMPELDLIETTIGGI